MILVQGKTNLTWEEFIGVDVREEFREKHGLEFRETTFLGKPAVVTSTNIDVLGIGLVSYYYFTIVNGHLVYFSYLFEDHNYDLVASDINKTLESFRLNEQ